jgi:two-component system response regulator HydG
MYSPDQPGSSDSTVLKGMLVLVVEDAWHVARAMKSALEQLGMQVVGPSATTAEARSLVAKRKPQLALVDLNLKQEMSDELIEELHKQGIQVIIVSGYSAPPVSVANAAAFLQKPFSGKELMTTLCAVAGRLG